MEKLSKAYKEFKYNRFAYCPNCKKVYKDDLPIYGSLYCPNKDCDPEDGRYCIQRGLKEIPQ